MNTMLTLMLGWRWFVVIILRLIDRREERNAPERRGLDRARLQGSAPLIGRGGRLASQSRPSFNLQLHRDGRNDQ